MEKYKNLNGNSSVILFEIHDNENKIIVVFQNKDEKMAYEYSSLRIGSIHYNNLVKLARQGHGLGSYIRKEPLVSTKYDKKYRYIG